LTTTDHITIKALIIKKLETLATQKSGQQRAKEIFFLLNFPKLHHYKIDQIMNQKCFQKE